MSIITKKKTTQTFLASLDKLPLNTQRCQRNTIKKFTVFVKETQNLTPDQLCEELLIMKKQDEDEYINTLYSILQDFIDDMITKISARSIKTNFAYLRGYLYHLGVRTNEQDIKMMLKFPKVQHEEKYPLKLEQLRKIVESYSRYPVIKAYKIPRNFGQIAHELDNLILLCARCNNQIQTSRKIEQLIPELEHKLQALKKLTPP